MTRTAASMGIRDRVTFDRLPRPLRDTIEARTGAIHRVEPVSSGLNSALAAVLHISHGTVFVKGVPSDHPGIHGLRREAAIARYVTGVGPQLRWQIDTGGWHLLGFEHLSARPADLSPGSADLALFADLLTQLGNLSEPDPELELPRIERRWAGLAEPDELALLAGEHLLHTDLNPNNILVTQDRAWLVDWAWPTRGAAWIDPACAVLWLIAEGHTPTAAESWAAGLPTWQHAPQDGLDSFVTLTVKLWTQIAGDDPAPWKGVLRDTALQWQTYRQVASPR